MVVVVFITDWPGVPVAVTTSLKVLTAALSWLGRVTVVVVVVVVVVVLITDRYPLLL